jgi:hypothetical protein
MSANAIQSKTDAGHGHQGEQGVDVVLGGSAFSLGLVGQQDAMPQDIRGDCLDVFRRDIVAPGEPGACPGAAIQRQGGAWTGTEAQPAVQLAIQGGRVTAGHDQLYQVFLDIRRHE